MAINSALALLDLSKSFGAVEAVANLSLTINRGEFFGLLGPSGCGKTTTLRLIAGLEQPDAGAIFFQDQEITHLPAKDRRIGMVFQHHALFPHLDVFANVAFGLRSKNLSRSEIAERVRQSLVLARFPASERRRIAELSSGEKQRVAIARAIAPEPPLLLFDEPLVNLDAALRAETRAELRELVAHLHLTALYVTHDQDEAFALCDRVALMNNGRLLQTAEARTLYEQPANIFVARFLGRNNIIRVEVIGEAQNVGFKTLTGGYVLSASFSVARKDFPARMLLSIRPEHVEIYRHPVSGDNVLPARVREIRFMGATTIVELTSSQLPLMALVTVLPEGIETGADCYVSLPPDKMLLLPE